MNYSINTNQTVSIIPNFLETTLCQKDKDDAGLIVFCIVLKSVGLPRGRSHQYDKNRSFSVSRKHTQKSEMCQTVSRFSIYTVKLVPIACKPAYWYLSQTIIIIRIICKLTILFHHSLITIPNNHDPLLKTFIKR